MFFTFLGFSQSPSVPDTVIIEKIKVQKKKIFIHKTDTVFINKTDTVFQTKRDTVYVDKGFFLGFGKKKKIQIVEYDTVYKKKRFLDPEYHAMLKAKRKAKFKANSDFLIGLKLGATGHFEFSHFLESSRDYFELEQESRKNLANFHLSLSGQFNYKKVFFSLESELTFVREELSIDQTISNNQLTYGGFELKGGYSFALSPKSSLLVGGGPGIQFLLGQKGSYINPEDISVVATNKDFYPTQPSLFTLGSMLDFQTQLSRTWSLSIASIYRFYLKSITPVSHPVLYYKSLLGGKIGVLYKF